MRIGHAPVEERQIVTHGPMEEPDVLRDKADPVTEIGKPRLSDVLSSYEYPAFAGVVETKEEPRHRGLAASRPAKESE